MIIESYKQTGPNFSIGYERRGLSVSPRLASGDDGALGFWNVMPKIFPDRQAAETLLGT
ncbi:MAG: hypothetical protein ACTS73_05965 [Arsenophonus sp. NEOnobi-MAG3]